MSQREHVEYAERLKDAQEDFEAESLALIASGDRETLVRRSREHGEWVRAYRLDGVARGVEYGGGVGMSTNMWAHWGYIAIDAEERAVKALQREDDDWLTDSFRSSLTAIVAAAFTIEGLNGAVCYFIPELEARQRWTKIMRTLQVQFDLSRINRLSQKMELLFELRDNAAHPLERVRESTPHPSKPTNTSVEAATYAPEEATRSVDFAFELLDECTSRPFVAMRSAARWARDHREGVERLLNARYRRA